MQIEDVRIDMGRIPGFLTVRCVGELGMGKRFHDVLEVVRSGSV